MQFELSEEQQLVKANMKEFCELYVDPVADEIDQEGRFPSENLKRLAEQDMMGIPYPEEYGGAGADFLTYIVTVEELSHSCATTGAVVAANTSLASFPLYRFGTEAQKKQYLTPLCKGEMLGAFAWKDAGGSGNPTAGVSAVRDEKGYVLNGTKSFVANAPAAGLFVVIAATDPAGGKMALSAFIVPAGTPGLTTGRDVKRMGVRGAAASDIIFNDCRVPAENLLGGEGDGARICAETLDSFRIAAAAQALGICRAAMDEAVRYSKERVQFDKPISSFQAIQWMLANMGTELEAARLLTYQAAWRCDNSLPYAREAAMAKVLATDAATSHSDAAVQIHGGIGTIKGQKVERLYRDAKVVQVMEEVPSSIRAAIGSSLVA